MYNSQKIEVSTNNSNVDKNIKVNLVQDVDTLEIMTLKIDTKDVYNNFNADYGVLIGRVNANGGVGISNVRVSIFIPLDEDDMSNGNIVSLYPYETPRDKNKEGKRYNLLPRVSKKDPNTGEIIPKQPFGSFPIKEEIVTNKTQLEVYKKYYKYSTVTNNSGDYMIFGVPVGTQIVHMSCDITDIGEYSMNPAAMVTNLGYSANLFTDNGTKIKPSNDLNDLPNIETQEVSVDVIPFWGNVENFEVGITRQDFRIRAELVNTFVIFGSMYTDGDKSMWGDNYLDNIRRVGELYRTTDEAEYQTSISSKRIGEVTEAIYFYPNTISDDEINNVDPTKNMVKLSKTEYSVYKRDGDFIFIINCNRKKVITNINGDKIIVDNNSPNGVFTEFKGFITLEYTKKELPMDFDSNIGNNTKITPFRCKIKIPQHADRNHSFRKETTSDLTSETDTNNWRKQYKTFKSNEFYSVSKFHGLVYNKSESKDANEDTGFITSDKINDAVIGSDCWSTVGIIQTSDNLDKDIGNEKYEMPSNSTNNGNVEYFGGNWMNFTIHLPQIGFFTGDNDVARNTVGGMRFNTNFSQNFKSDYYYNDNTQEIVGGDFNTKYFTRSDLHYTDFIHIPKKDINSIYTYGHKGFKLSEINAGADALIGDEYKNGEDDCPYHGGRLNANPDNVTTDPETYFFRGFGESDALGFLVELGIVNI